MFVVDERRDEGAISWPWLLRVDRLSKRGCWYSFLWLLCCVLCGKGSTKEARLVLEEFVCVRSKLPRRNKRGPRNSIIGTI